MALCDDKPVRGCKCDNCFEYFKWGTGFWKALEPPGGWGGKKPNFQSRGNKSQQSRQQSAQRAQRRDRSDRTSPHNDGIKSNRNPKRR